MRHVIRYRLRDSALIEDHVLQSVLFRDLIHHRPPWVVCTSYELGDNDRALLIDVSDFDRIKGLLALSYYLNGLDTRCQFEPERDVIDGAVPEPPAQALVGCWNPADDEWCVPYRGWPTVGSIDPIQVNGR